MDVKNRKTTLGDDAEIYNRRSDTVSKEDLKGMSKRQKLGYFHDYYLVGLLVIIAVIVFIVYFVYTMVINPSKEILTISCLTGAYVEDTGSLGEAVKQYLGDEREKDYVGVSYYDVSDPQMNMAYTTIAGAGQVDIIICSYEEFQHQASLGMLADLSEILPPETYERLADRMYTGQIVERDVDGVILSVGEELPYGIDITDSPIRQQYILGADKIVLSLFAAPPNRDFALRVVDYFTE